MIDQEEKTAKGLFKQLTAQFSREMKHFLPAVTGPLIIVVLSCASYQRNLAWHDPVKMPENTAQKSPGKGRVHYNLATRLSAAGRIDRAKELFGTAIRH